jgi:hypothetical protein
MNAREVARGLCWHSTMLYLTRAGSIPEDDSRFDEARRHGSKQATTTIYSC